MTVVVFLRHFETEVDEDRPVSEWELTPDGEAAMEAFLDSDTIDGIERVYTSPEHKARRTARAVADETGVPLETLDQLREVDRSGEGFIEDHDEYVRMVGQYLQNPVVPFDWEDREGVEERIEGVLGRIDPSADRVLVVSHGMFLSTLIPPLTGEDRETFWQDLGFGECLELDLEELIAYWLDGV